MNFSELFRQSGQLCIFSPDGKFLASAVDYRLVIRDVETLQIQHLFSCLDEIQSIQWSGDSQFILCGMFKRGMVQVWSLEVPDWHCKIDEGSAGLCSVVWGPDSRHILTTADFHLRVTVWSLVTKSVSYIRYPKQCSKGLDFSRGGKYMALAERRDCKDHISIFSCQSWSLIRHFESETDDLAGLEWSPDARVLCVWDSCLTYKVLLYSLDGRCLSRFSAYDLALGVKTLSWSPSSQFLAVGSYDEKIRLLNHITWKTVATLSHPEIIDGKNIVVYKESETRTPSAPDDLSRSTTAALFTPQSKYEVAACPVQVPVTKPAPNKANPKIGIGSLAFSHDNKYMFSRNDNMPCVLWIWDVRRLGLCAVLIQANPIKSVSWDPSRPRLALSTANNKLFMWSSNGSLSVEIPVEGTFMIHHLLWHPEGDSILLIGKEQMCVCFLAPTEVNVSAVHNTSTINNTEEKSYNSNKNDKNSITVEYLKSSHDSNNNE
ncbi:WD repeat-containing protein WRAP73-like [Physella acuta]|uniref:WD repeat-containing protein WRAP73-like n=1 Tax=Physella acuta TaxID=109671 RepID=UPI0027DC5FB7|nr:WD repeat-containing protein WRAP73-like [Physella acuta]